MDSIYPQEQARAALAAAIGAGAPVEIANALLAVVSGDSDWVWLETQCIALLDHPASEVRGIAATSLGHIARLYGRLHRDAVERLQNSATDSAIGGRVEDALSDIDRFVGEAHLE